VLGEVLLEEQYLCIENARLKDELDRVCALAGKFLGHTVSSGSPVSCLQGCSGLELGVGTNNGFGASSLPPIPDLMGAAGLPAGIAGGLDGADGKDEMAGTATSGPAPRVAEQRKQRSERNLSAFLRVRDLIRRLLRQNYLCSGHFLNS
jgi:hypothetical protein